MRAYYELETNIPLNHQLSIQLPDSIPVGRAIITIIYEENQDVANKPPQPKTLIDFLGTGKKYQRFSSISEIDNFISENFTI